MPECLWLTPILQDSLRHIYQRFILESDGDVVEMVHKVIKSSSLLKYMLKFFAINILLPGYMYIDCNDLSSLPWAELRNLIKPMADKQVHVV